MPLSNPVGDITMPTRTAPRPVMLVDRSGNYVSLIGSSTFPIAAGVATDTTVKGTPGTLVRVLVTATGTGTLLIYDNVAAHTGTIIGAVPANATQGSLFTFCMPALVGITVQGSANNPGITVSFD